MKLLCGLYEPTSGVIYYNGIPHTELLPADIRRQMTMISQTYFKYGLTLSDNITFGREDAETFGRLETSLSLNEITENDRTRYSRPMLSQYNENALELSEGQWQRIAAARGLYKTSASVLLMDEPSSALDAISEDTLFSCVGESGFCLRFVVTHRLACVRDISRIVVLVDGKVAEDGRHTELVKQGKLYAELFTTQAEKYM